MTEFYTWSEPPDRDPDTPIRTGRITLIRRRKTVGIINFDEFEDHIDMYCPHCEKYSDIKSKLGPRILQKGKPIPVDHDVWKMCYKCGNVYGLHEVAQESDIRNTVETLDSPFESNQSEILGANPRRTSREGKRLMDKRRKERDRPHHKDPDIDKEMARHGDRVTVVYDSNP